MANWKKDLGAFFDKKNEAEQLVERTEMGQLVHDAVIPAFAEISKELESHGRKIVIRDSETSAAIVVNHNGEEELSYRIQGRTFPNGVLPFAEVRFRERGGHKLLTIESMFRSGSPGYSIKDITKNEIIEHFIENYTTRVKTG